MLFARSDWFLNLGISSTIHLLAVSGEKKMAREPHFVVKYSSYLGTAIKLVLYILKQLFASVSVNSGGYLPRRSGSVNIHRYSPPLRRIIVKYHKYWNISVHYSCCEEVYVAGCVTWTVVKAGLGYFLEKKGCHSLGFVKSKLSRYGSSESWIFAQICVETPTRGELLAIKDN